jgi:hypothetical protein
MSQHVARVAALALLAPGLWRNAQGAYLVREDGSERPALRWLRDYVRRGAVHE